MAQTTCTLTGIILKAVPAGEFDKRLTILTRERGKVTAFAQGARRAKGSMQASTQIFCFGRFEAIEYRDYFKVVKTEISNYFSGFLQDLEANYYGCYFLELADYFTQLHNEATDQLKLLYQSLRALETPALDRRLTRLIYELKTLVYYGVAPDVFSCIKCRKEQNLKLFYIRGRGVLCQQCMGQTAGYQLDEASLYTLQYIISSPIEKLYTFKVTEEVYQTIRQVIRQYLKLYVDRELNTLLFLPEE